MLVELQAHSAEATGSEPHVVIIDDEQDLCVLLSLRLQHHGFRVSSARGSQEALQILERETVDAAILDVRLEDENGLDVLVEMQKRALDLPIVVLTAHGTIEVAVEAMKRGAYGFLTKPFDTPELLQKLHHAVERGRLRREVDGLRRLIQAPTDETRLLGASAAIGTVREIVARVAPSDATVLISGESGTGKEVAARCIHALSGRSEAPFVAINCGALTPTLLESELFGHKRGSFTGAVSDKDGLFAVASGGTLFLDEIGDAPPSVQVKLLRVLQERCYLPVGSTEPLEVDVRILAATNRDLQADVEAGRFREDLFYRIHVVPLVMPPLRERRDDIPLLAELFLNRACAKHGLSTPQLSSAALQLLMGHTWPGNVRELANVVEGGALLASDGVLDPEHLPIVLPPSSGGSLGTTASVLDVVRTGESLPPMREAREAFDRTYLEEVLQRSRGNVREAARLAGRNRTDFYELMRRYGIAPAAFR